MKRKNYVEDGRAYPNIFDIEVSDGIIARLHTLTPETQRQWGKMDVGRMLAHCNVAYECIYELDKHPKPKFPMSLILKYIVGPFVVGDNPPKKISPTGPQFIIADEREVERERTRLIDFHQSRHRTRRGPFRQYRIALIRQTQHDPVEQYALQTYRPSPNAVWCVIAEIQKK